MLSVFVTEAELGVAVANALPHVKAMAQVVTNAARGQGVGRRLLVHLARLARERGCGRLEWAVLNWNEPAMKFYRALGAGPKDDWTIFRLTGDA